MIHFIASFLRLASIALALAAVALFDQRACAQTGACCIGTSCSLRTFSNCDNAGGDWLGPSTNCSGSPCSPPSGTCCTGTTCTIRTATQCSSAGGTFLGGSSCAPNPCSGSCCLNGGCTITALSTCSSSGGTWLRFGSCSPSICTGPCCDNGICTITVQSLCTGGAVWTPGGACNPNSCLPPRCEAPVTGNIGGLVTAVARVGTSGLLVARGTTLELFNLVNANAPAPFSPPRRLLLGAPAVKISISPGSGRAFVLLENSDITYVTIVTSPQLLITDPVTIGGSGVPDILGEGDRVYIPRSLTSHGEIESSVFIYERGADGQPDYVERIDTLLQNFAVDRIAKIGNVLWLGMRESESNVYGIEGWNVADPSAPVHVVSSLNFAQLGVETEISTLQAVGNRLLLSFKTRSGSDPSEDWLRAVDVTNPAAPVWHPAVDLNGTAQCASANGNHLRICIGSSTQTWDTTNPASLALLGTWVDSPVSALQITSGSTVDYLASGSYGLRAVSFTLPAFPAVQSTVPTMPALASLVRQSGNLSVLVDHSATTLRVFDFTLPESQQLRGSVALSTSRDLLELTRINGGTQLLACAASTFSSNIAVYELTNPAAPVLRATIPLGPSRLISAANSRLYVLTGLSELRIYDLTIPSAPLLLSTTPFGGSPFDFTALTSWESGPTKAAALGTASFGLWLIDATNGASPEVAAVHSPVVSYRVHSLTKGPGFLYVSSGNGFPETRLESLNVGNLASPVVEYVTAEGLGAGEQGTFSELVYISAPSGRFLAGKTQSGTTIRFFDLTSPLGEAYLHGILTTLAPPSSSGLSPSGTGARLLFGSFEGGVQQLSLPQTWAPGFSAPAFATRSACLGGTTNLHVQASANPTSITYQWFRAGNPHIALVNGAGPAGGGAAISGATSPTLTLTNLHAREDGTFYFCIATNSCGASTSDSVRLEVCIADFDCSGMVTVQDLFDFLTAYFAVNTLADVNASGAVSVQDIFDYLEAYFAGCL